MGVISILLGIIAFLCFTGVGAFLSNKLMNNYLFFGLSSQTQFIVVMVGIFARAEHARTSRLRHIGGAFFVPERNLLTPIRVESTATPFLFTKLTPKIRARPRKVCYNIIVGYDVPESARATKPINTVLLGG